MSNRRLDGKIALVTGAASGIGRAVCKRFAEEGASIVAVDLNADELKKTIGSLNNFGNVKHLSFCGDVSDVKFADQLFKQTKVAYNKACSILVNSAGIVIRRKLVNMSPEAFDEVIRVNLKGVFVMSKAFVLSLNLDENNPKPVSIVNISSVGGEYGMTTLSNYCASKAGVIGFTKSIGTELAKYGVRCNSVLPGFIETPMTKEISQKAINKMLQRIPLRRNGTVEEIANACLFLASEESSFITCASLEVTGGYAARM